MRFDWGTVGHPCSTSRPPLIQCAVPAPIPSDGALAPDGSGQLLALGDKLNPRWQDERSSLLEVEFADLGMEVWRLKFDENGGGPVLEVNKNIEGISFAVRHDEAFRSLVLPEVLRSILTRALIVEGENPDDDGENSNWRPWMLCVRNFYHEEYPQMSDDEVIDNGTISEWIDNVVAAFTDKRFRAKTFYEGVLRK